VGKVAHVGTGARISPHALIGSPPEHRDYRGHYNTWQTPYDDLFPRVGADATIEAFCTVDSGTYRATEIGARSYLMKRVHVAHDCIVGEDCELSVGVSLGGSVTVGNRVRMGVGAAVRPFIRIGDGARVGLGSAVVKDIPPYQCWAGDPATFLYFLCEICGDRASLGDSPAWAYLDLPGHNVRCDRHLLGKEEDPIG